MITGSLLTIVPLIVAFLFLQRYWQSGLAPEASRTSVRSTTAAHHGHPPMNVTQEVKGIHASCSTPSARTRRPHGRSRSCAASRRLRVRRSGGGQPTRHRPTDVDAALAEGRHDHRLELDARRPRPRSPAFEKKYPNVKVELVNAGTGNDQYTKLQNAIKAGTGAPDVAQIEYYALPQFALADSLVDLSQYGFGQPDERRTRAVDRGTRCTLGGGVYGLPQDSGPMALFYNKAGLRQVRHRRADHLGRVRRGRQEAARGRPEELHHQRHR